MPRCIVPGCTSGYDSNKEKRHFFTLPKSAEIVEQWGKAMKRKDVKSRQAVCQNHFRTEEILWQRPLLGADGTVLGISHLKIPRLAKGAIPSIFPWTEFIEPPNVPKEIPETNTAVSHKRQLENTEKHSPAEEDVSTLPPKRQKVLVENKEKVNPPLEDLQPQNQETLDHPDDDVQAVDSAVEVRNLTSVSLTFQQLLEAEINLPPGWVVQKTVTVASTCCDSTKMIVLSTLICLKVNGVYEPHILKSVTVKDDLSINICALGKHVDMQKFKFPCKITQMAELNELIHKLYTMNVCKGATGSLVDMHMSTVNCSTVHKDCTGTWRHNNCSLLLSKVMTCKDCRNIPKTIATKYRRWTTGKVKEIRYSAPDCPVYRKKMIRLRDSLRAAQASVVKTTKQCRNLKAELKMAQMRVAHCTNLEEALKSDNISENQAHALHQIVNAAKRKNSKGRNYSEEWMLLCMLLHMRSSSGYDFLRNNDMLPLPCPRTMRRYLSKMNSTCGFDSKFFEIFKTTLAKKDELQRHGILLLDETSTQESASVDTKNLTYKELVDFGDNEQRRLDLSEKANHGLVFMFQALNDTYTQPIGAFASRGPVKGEVLAQLIIKAIILLEGIGAKIHAVVSDGASPNRKFWTEVGVSGVKGQLRNFFDHPLDADRKIFIFSDPAHLIKSIRNRLHNNKDCAGLRMSSTDPIITWKHIKTLQEKDKELTSPGQLLVCPKLTSEHVNLNNELKMRIHLAVQVFSNSVAAGLRFYEKIVPELKGCEGTASFCKWMNDMFDALNRKHPIDGVQVGNADFKIIEESLKKLDVWEEQVETKKLRSDYFLTKQIAECLRVTLQSCLDLIRYLTENCGFQYVLTNRINQDALEV